MAFIVDQEGYQYASLVAATVFLIPQLRLGYKTESLKDISTTSMIFVLFGSSLWAFYMYENALYVYAGMTLFVGLQATAVMLMQVHQYYARVNEHMLSFEQPPPPSINLTTVPPSGENAV